MYEFNLHAVAPFFSHLISIIVCAFVILKNHRSALHITLAVFCFFASLWQFGTGMMFISQNDKLAIFWDRIVYIGVNFMWATHFHFSILFSKSNDKKPWLVAAYLIAIFYAFFIFSDYLIHDLYRYSWGCHTTAGPLHHSFVLISTAFYMKSLYLIYRSYRRTSNVREKAQYKYYFVGFTIYVSASLAYLPAYKIAIYPFAYWFETLYCLILVYIIIKHRMLDIETVAHKTLLWVTISAAALIPSTALAYLLRPVFITLPPAGFTLSILGLVVLAVLLYALAQPRIDGFFERKTYNYRSIIRTFTDKAVTLHDKGLLARMVRKTLRKTLHAKTACVFWMDHQSLREAISGPGPFRSFNLNNSLIVHMLETHDLFERDFILTDPDHQPFYADLKALFDTTASYMVVPIIHESRLLGLITLAKKTTLKSYTEMDKQFLKELIVGISFAMINSQMFETQQELLEKEKEARLAQEELVRIKDDMNKALESKVEERTRELNLTLDKVKTANNHILEGLRYSRILQKSMLPDRNSIKAWLPDSFFIWKPRDIVGGDTYFCERFARGFIVILIDCTGHGVPGAFMTMLASSALQRIVREERILDPSMILKRLNYTIKTSLQQTTEHSKSDDGLDAAVCFFDFETRDLLFGASRLPLYMIKDGSLEIIKGDAHSIGYVSSDLSFEFTTHKIPNADKNMTFYMTTDGYVDQLGGERYRRFGKKRFKQLLIDLHALDFNRQQALLLTQLAEHQGDNTQTDDVTLAGFSLSSAIHSA